MDFFGIGAGELLLILVVALIIWGPEKLPEIARTLGRTVRALRKATFDLTTEVTKELDKEEKEHPSQPGKNSDIKPKNRQMPANSRIRHRDDQPRSSEKQ